MQSIESWRAERLAALTAEDGWLNLTDRIEIPPGPQSVGAAPENDLVLSAGPHHLGVLTLTNGGAELRLRGGPPLCFQPSQGGFAQLRVPPLLLELHTVDDIPALRVRDLTLPRQIQLQYFPEDPAWAIRARWLTLAAPVAQIIAQKGGSETAVQLTHVAEFTHEGHNVRLLATHWKGGKPMFVIRDATSGGETYAASRFLIGEAAGADEISLDFNRAFTPPCGFTDFAICPLPPRENILSFAVRAGEKMPRTTQL